ncbi:MAG: substrate-binding domain-containing protein [Paludibacteraceae bacterium]|nr:substrate-binding domain-containing protein [Paludibacteraceae bacterium]
MKKLYFILLLGVLLISCGQKEYRIGVSQCQDDAWRQKMNAEMQRELLYHPELKIYVREAECHNALQCAQIDSFIREGVDLLIVSPNEAEEVKPAVSRAYKAGIPVIVADRRVTGEEWTAFVGGDNLAVGRMMGHWVQQKAKKAGRAQRIMEITGLPGSTPAVLRHQGLIENIGESMIVAQGMGAWLQDDARRVTDSLLAIYPDIDLILAQNDLMAIGATEALAKHHLTNGKRPAVMGVDGLDSGLQAIIDGRIEVTTTYASRGDMIIQTAVQILKGEPFVRDTVLETSIVDIDAARALWAVNEQNAHDVATIRFLQSQMDAYWQRSRVQTILLWVMLGMLVACVLVLVNYLLRNIARLTEETEITPVKTPKDKDVEDTLTPKMRAYIDAHLSDPDLSVELLSEEMGMSRAQLFRKTKALCGKAPVEIIREQRLKKAKELLQTTDWNIQQVAYEVGFTSPSYFTKCYKEQYGENPKK